MTRPVLRFAPSPNGRLHLGHAYSALLNADLAGRLGGTLLLRIEDIDPGRARPEHVAAIHADLAWLGIAFAGEVRHQSGHFAEYRAGLDRLARAGLAYPCFCSRGDIAARVARTAGEGGAVPSDPDGVALYPGTCRTLSREEADARRAAGEAHTWRLDMRRALAAAPGPRAFPAFDARDPAGACRRVEADPARWGDAMIARRDVPTSYHLSVVIDDAGQGVTHVVRGEDLRPATDLHALLQALLGLAVPAYHHHALIRDADGRKLAKSRGSASLADLRAGGASPESVRRRLGLGLSG